jgi:hypothetical protein
MTLFALLEHISISDPHDPDQKEHTGRERNEQLRVTCNEDTEQSHNKPYDQAGKYELYAITNAFLSGSYRTFSRGSKRTIIGE